MKSILQDERECFLCGKQGRLELHHTMNGKGWRKLSDEDGLVIYLCPDCHRNVHDDAVLRKALKRLSQMRYLEEHSFKEWMERYGKNYIDECN